MDAFLIYLLKSAVFFTVLYVCIRAFLSNETFFRFNRWVLLVGVTLCLVLPFVRVTISENIASHIPAVMLEKALASHTQTEAPVYMDSYINDVAFPNTVVAEETDSAGMNIRQILLLVYVIGLTVNLVILAKSVYLMVSVIRAGSRRCYKGYKLILSSRDVTPFSWGKYIVLSESDFNNHPEEILTHEVAHIRLNHSVDLIFMEFILLLQWFNPAVWLLKRELKDIHEYQADISVLQSGIDATKYQLLLVKKAVGASSYTLANSFNHSKIKKRITMMLKEKSSKWARLKLLLLLPLGTLTVFAFAHPETEDVMDSFRVDEVTKNISDKISIGDTNDDIVNTYLEGKFNITHSTDTKADVNDIQQKKVKPDYYKFTAYIVDGKKISLAEYEKLKANSLEILHEEYIPFAKGKVVKIIGVFNTGEKSQHPYYREMFVDGKAPDRSHVEFVIDGVAYDYVEGAQKAAGIKFATMEEAKECKSANAKPKTFQIKSKDGSRSSKVFYVVSFTPPPPPIKKNSKKMVIVKDEDPDLSSRKVGDIFTDAKGREWEVTSIDPPEMKLKSSSSSVSARLSKKGYKPTESIKIDKDKQTPPPPPPIKKSQTEKEDKGDDSK